MIQLEYTVKDINFIDDLISYDIGSEDNTGYFASVTLPGWVSRLLGDDLDKLMEAFGRELFDKVIFMQKVDGGYFDE